MLETFGDFVEKVPAGHDALELSFTPTSRPIKQRWRNNRLSAHFVADYFSSFIPVDEEDPKGKRRILESKSAVSYVANELLENAMKFNYEKVKSQVKFGMYFLEDFDEISDEITVIIFASNTVVSDGVDKFKTFIEELISCDPNELYIRQIEKAAEEEDAKASGLGLLTMINDYEAKLGWKFDTVIDAPEITTVTTMAQIKL